MIILEFKETQGLNENFGKTRRLNRDFSKKDISNIDAPKYVLKY